MSLYCKNRNLMYLYSICIVNMIPLSSSSPSLRCRFGRLECTCTHLYRLVNFHTHTCHSNYSVYVSVYVYVCVCVQVVLVSLLWGLKLSPAGMIYPVAIVGLIPIHWFLRRYLFTHTEMEAVSLG